MKRIIVLLLASSLCVSARPHHLRRIITVISATAGAAFVAGLAYQGNHQYRPALASGAIQRRAK